MMGFLQAGCGDVALGTARLVRLFNALPVVWKNQGTLRACPGLLTCVSLLRRGLGKMHPRDAEALEKQLHDVAVVLGVA